MGTLYDLLGALPSDDAEGLRTAFRKAAKATHPDINPDQPDAALRFRELVRAYDILTDAGSARPTINCSPLRFSRRRPRRPCVPMRLSARSLPTRWRQRSFRRCWSEATSCSEYFQNHQVLRKSRPTRSPANRKSSQHCNLRSPLRTSRPSGARGTHRPSAPSRYRRLRPQRKRQTPRPLAVSNLSRGLSHTIWRFNITRASQPPASTAASFYIAAAISTARSPCSLRPSLPRTHGGPRSPPLPAQATGDPASCAPCTAREANADHRRLDELIAGGNAPVMTSRRPLPSSAAAAPRPAAATSDIPRSRRDPPAAIARCS